MAAVDLNAQFDVNALKLDMSGAAGGVAVSQDNKQWADEQAKKLESLLQADDWAAVEQQVLQQKEKEPAPLEDKWGQVFKDTVNKTSDMIVADARKSLSNRRSVNLRVDDTTDGNTTDAATPSPSSRRRSRPGTRMSAQKEELASGPTPGVVLIELRKQLEEASAKLLAAEKERNDTLEMANDLRQKITELTAQIDAGEAELRRREEEYEAKEHELLEARAHLETKLQESTAELTKLQQQVFALEDEKLEAQNTLDLQTVQAAEERAKYAAREEALKKDQAFLESKLLELATAVEQMTDSLESKKSLLAQQKAQFEEASEKKEQELRALQAEVAEQKQLLHDRIMEMKEVTDLLEVEKKVEQDKSAHLETTFAAERTEMLNKLDELHITLEFVEAKAKEAEEQLLKESEEHKQKLSAERTELTAQLTALQAALAQATAQSDTTETARAELEQRILQLEFRENQLNAQNKRWEDTVNVMTESVTQLKEDKLKLEEAMAQTRGRLEEESKQLARLEEEKAALTAEWQQRLDTLTAERTDWQQRTEALQTEKAQLEEQLAKQQADLAAQASAQDAGLAARIEALQQERESLEAQWRQRIEQLETDKQQLEAQLAAMTDRHTAMESKYQQLIEQSVSAVALQGEAARSEEALRALVVQLEGQVTRVNSYCLDLQQQLEAKAAAPPAPTPAVVGEGEGTVKLAALRALVEQLEAQIGAVEARSDALSAAAAEAAQSKANEAALKVQVEQAQRELEALKQKAAEWEHKVTQSTASSDEMALAHQAALEKQAREHAEEKRTLLERQTQLDTQMQALQARIAEADAAAKELDRSHAEQQTLFREKEEQWSRQVRELLDEKERLALRIGEMEQRIEAQLQLLTEKEHEMRKLNDAHLAEVGKLNAQLLQASQDDIQRSATVAQDLSAKIFESEQRVDRLTAEAATAAQRVTELETERAELRARVDQLITALSDTQSAGDSQAETAAILSAQLKVKEEMLQLKDQSLRDAQSDFHAKMLGKDAEIIRLQEERRLLEEANSRTTHDLTLSRAEVFRLEKELNHLRGVNNRLTAEHDALALRLQGTGQKAERQKTMMQDETRSLLSKVQELVRAKSEESEQQSQVEGQLRTQVSLLQQTVGDQRKKLAYAEEHATELEQQVRALKTKLAEANATVDRIQAERDALVTGAGESEKSFLESTQKMQASLQATISLLKKSLEDEKASYKQLAVDFKKKEEALIEDKKKANQEADDVRAKYMTKLNKAAEKEKDLTSKLGQAEEKLHTLEEEVLQLQEQKSEMELQSRDKQFKLKQEIDDLSHQKRLLEAELQQLKSDHEAAESKLHAEDALMEMQVAHIREELQNSFAQKEQEYINQQQSTTAQWQAWSQEVEQKRHVDAEEKKKVDQLLKDSQTKQKELEKTIMDLNQRIKSLETAATASAATIEQQNKQLELLRGYTAVGNTDAGARLTAGQTAGSAAEGAPNNKAARGLCVDAEGKRACQCVVM